MKFFELYEKFKVLRCIITILPLVLILLFTGLLLTDVSRVYTVVYKNQKEFEADKSKVKIESIEKDESGAWYKIKVNGSDELQVEKADFILMLGHEDELWWSYTANCVMQGLGKGYVNTILQQSNVLYVLPSWFFITLIMFLAYKKGTLGIMSKKSVFVLYCFEGVLLGLLIAGSYLVFS